jgi:hypothetical protein
VAGASRNWLPPPRPNRSAMAAFGLLHNKDQL